eukprot:m.2675 g.2675  ORF g.2675 m.2675 type:complete len:150 (-) comp1494_c0_seq1:858-1307(-)
MSQCPECKVDITEGQRFGYCGNLANIDAELKDANPSKIYLHHVSGSAEIVSAFFASVANLPRLQSFHVSGIVEFLDTPDFFAYIRTTTTLKTLGFEYAFPTPEILKPMFEALSTNRSLEDLFFKSCTTAVVQLKAAFQSALPTLSENSH